MSASSTYQFLESREIGPPQQRRVSRRRNTTLPQPNMFKLQMRLFRGVFSSRAPRTFERATTRNSVISRCQDAEVGFTDAGNCVGRGQRNTYYNELSRAREIPKRMTTVISTRRSHGHLSPSSSESCRSHRRTKAAQAVQSEQMLGI